MKKIERIAASLFGVAFLVLALAVAVETMSRKVFNWSLQGVDELGGYILAVGAAMAFAVTLCARAHIRIDIVHDQLPRGLRIILNLLATPALAACSIAVVVMAGYSLQDSIAFSSTAQTPWATPLKYPQMLWMASLGVFCIVALVETLRLLRLAIQGRFDEIDRRFGPRGTKDELAEELADLEARGVAAADGPGPTAGGRS